MSNKLYKPGDKVVIRDDLVDGVSYDEVDFVSGMLGYKGKTATIQSVNMVSYSLKEFGYFWNDQMFETILPEKNDDALRTEDAQGISEISTKDLFGLYNL